LTKDGKASIRRNNDKVDCGQIAKNMIEGGGHTFASGGRIRSNPDDFNNIIKEIREIVLKSTNNNNNN
jgi:nanoRNase/pAp phosphatase (c-di-AMP/oligoRNAs hydrolase)